MAPKSILKRLDADTINKELIGTIEGFIQRNHTDALAKIFDELKPADAADVIEHLVPDERLFIFNLLTPEGAGDVLVEIEPPVQKQILADLDNRFLSEILQEVDADDAADIIGILPETLGPELSKELEKLLQYGKDTAGGIMDLEYVSVAEDGTVEDVVKTIREKGKKVKNLYHVWVVDDLKRLTGVVSLKDLLMEAPKRKINEFMNPEVISVDVNMDQEDVALMFKKYDLVNFLDDRRYWPGNCRRVHSEHLKGTPALADHRGIWRYYCSCSDQPV